MTPYPSMWRAVGRAFEVGVTQCLDKRRLKVHLNGHDAVTVGGTNRTVGVARPRGRCAQPVGARPQGGLPVHVVTAWAALVAAFTGDNAPVRLRLRTGARVTPNRNHPGTAFRTRRLNVSASLRFIHISPKKSQCLEAKAKPW